MNLRGCFPVICTPFKADGSIDAEDFDNVVEFLVSVGVDGVVYPGVASEVDTLTGEERAFMIERLGRKLNGRLPLIVGASANEPDDVIAHIGSGAAAGAAAAMVMAPAVLDHDLDAHRAFFGELAKETNLPVMLQNAPSPVGAGLPPSDVAMLAQHPAIVYVKEETMPCGQNLSRISEAAEDTIKGVFGGAGGRYITDELARGALGTLPASELADIHVRLVRAWQAGNRAEARRLFQVSMPLLNFQAIFRMHMTKETLRQRGVISSTHVRGAGPSMDAGDRAELQALLDQFAPEFETYPLRSKEAAE